MNQVIYALFHIIVLLFVIAGILYMLHQGERSMRMILFGMAMACVLLSDVYWLTFDFMYPEKRLPFAANELAEWAMFLLIGKLLVTELARERVPVWKEIAAMAVFSAINAAMWIHWSGEWIQDIVTGVALGYLLCCLAIRMKTSGQITGRERILLGIACAVAVVLQGISIFTEEPVNVRFETACYIFLMVVLAVLLVCAVLEIFVKNRTERGVCFATAMLAWCVVSMYMSADVWYTVCYIGSSVSVLLMFFAMRKEVKAV